MTRWLLLVLGMLSACRGQIPYRVNGPGFFVIAVHGKMVSVITETNFSPSEVETTVSGGDGTFTVKEPTWVLFGNPTALIIISKAGYRTWVGHIGERNIVGPTRYRDYASRSFELERAQNFHEESAAQRDARWHLEAHRAGRLMSTATKERVDAHFRQRERYLKRTYPFAFFSKDAIKPRSWRFGRVRLSSWDAHRKSSLDRNQIVAMPHGALLLVASKGGGSSPVDPTHFRLMLLDRNNRLAKQLTLPPPATGLGQKTPIVGVGEEDRLLLFDGNRGELQRISDQLKLEEKTELKPWDPKKEHGVSIAGHPDGYLLGVMRTITRVKANRSSGVHVVPINAPRTIIESHEQSVVRIYSKTGRLIRERSLVGLKSMRQAAMLPDGRVVASGSLPQKDASELLVQIGAHVKAERPDGVILCPESDGPGQLVVRGTDRFALGPEAIWAVVSDMFDKKIYARLGSSETSESRPASRRDLLIKVPLDGSKQRIWDITDRRLGPFRAASLAKQGDTLYLINEHQNPSWADVIEIDLGRLEGSEKAS